MADRYDQVTGFHVLDKNDVESILFDIDLKKRMRSLDTIASVTSVSAVKRGLVPGSSDITITGGTANGTVAQARIAGGTPNEEYVVTFVVLTDGLDVISGSGILQVH